MDGFYEWQKTPPKAILTRQAESRLPTSQKEAAMTIPEDLIEIINRLIRTSQRMLVEKGREPTMEELAERLSMPVDRVKRLLQFAQRPAII